MASRALSEIKLSVADEKKQSGIPKTVIVYDSGAAKLPEPQRELLYKHAEIPLEFSSPYKQVPLPELLAKFDVILFDVAVEDTMRYYTEYRSYIGENKNVVAVYVAPHGGKITQKAMEAFKLKYGAAAVVKDLPTVSRDRADYFYRLVSDDISSGAEDECADACTSCLWSVWRKTKKILL